MKGDVCLEALNFCLLLLQSWIIACSACCMCSETADGLCTSSMTVPYMVENVYHVGKDLGRAMTV